MVEQMQEQGITMLQVAYWQNGSWRSYIPGFGPDDFVLEYGRGYFVKIANPGRWLPS